MKYRVIGWTFYEDNEILISRNTIGFAERNAIIDEIRKHKYLFSGWHHQESLNGVVPILNDCRKRCFSQRGWGGVMAEAYEEMGDYDYAGFTFHQSISSNKLRFAPDDFDINQYEPEAVENEYFKVTVNEGLFEIAKTSNPFYLEDLESLRYIDKNDIITLCFNDEELTFVVKDIDRNKVEIGLKNAKELIKGEYKIIVTHKPESERKLSKVPQILTTSSAFDLFEEAMEEYNYDVIEEAMEYFNLEYFVEDLEKEKTRDSLSRFVKEYSNNSYNAENILQILRYLDSYELFEEIASKTFEKDKSIYVAFINYYLREDKKISSHVFKFVNYIKSDEYLYNDSINILFKAISLKPNNKSLRKKCYRLIKNSRYDGLPILAGANLFNYLRKKDKCLIELDKYTSYDETTILKIVEYLTYPKAINQDNYPFYLPKIYEIDEKIISDGVKAYQQYIKEHFDVEDIMEKMLLYGIDKKCFEMNRYFRGEEYASKYILALDILTNYKYNLKEKALAKYASEYENFEKELKQFYS